MDKMDGMNYAPKGHVSKVVKEGEFLYCYSTNLHAFLQSEGQRFICTGFHERTHRKFWQYQRTDALNNLLTKYAENKPA
jgi:hypothetical protein